MNSHQLDRATGPRPRVARLAGAWLFAALVSLCGCAGSADFSPESHQQFFTEHSHGRP